MITSGDEHADAVAVGAGLDQQQPVPGRLLDHGARGSGGRLLRLRVLDELDREHRARARARRRSCPSAPARRASAPGSCRRSLRRARRGSPPRRRRARRAQRPARPGCRRRCPPIAESGGASMISALPITAESGSPPAIDFAIVIRSGSTPWCSMPHMLPVRPNPVCTSSTTNTIPCSSQMSPHALHELRRRDDEAALAEDRLHHDRGHGLGRRPASRTRARSDLSAESTSSPRYSCGIRHAVDLGRERAEARLVRVRLRGHRHREQRAAVEGALERDHRGPLRVGARELDRVLDRLGARR